MFGREEEGGGGGGGCSDVVKLVDMGTAACGHAAREAQGRCGTPAFMAPEMLAGVAMHHTTQSDV